MFSYVTVRCRQLRSTWEKARLNNPLGCASAELACQAYQDSCKLTGSVVLSRKTSSRWSQNALRKERKKIFFFFFLSGFIVHHKQVKMRSILSLLYFVMFCFCFCFLVLLLPNIVSELISTEVLAHWHIDPACSPFTWSFLQGYCPSWLYDIQFALRQQPQIKLPFCHKHGPCIPD